VCCVDLCGLWLCVFLYELLCMCVDACVSIGLDKDYVTDCVCVYVDVCSYECGMFVCVGLFVGR